MAEAQIKIISLTITEGGYNFNSSSGNFISEHPDIVWDLAHPQQPRTIFGYLTQSLQLRFSEGRPGLSILSCDNIQHNGDVLKKMLCSYLNLAAPHIVHWVNENVSFPNSMVDRITPAAVAADRKYLQDTFQLEDGCPVVAEPFFQWIIEDNFIAGRPTLEWVNVQFVKDVTAFENMKLRLLNAGHSLLGFLGKAGGHVFIHEAMQHPQIAEQLVRFYQEEAVPNIKGVPSLELQQYVATLQNRFANPYIKDQVERIIAGSSAKIPKFILPTVWDQINRGAGLEISATVIASWCKYLATVKDGKQVNDEASNELVARARQSFNEHSCSFLEIESVFGDLYKKEAFVQAFSSALDKLRK